MGGKCYSVLQVNNGVQCNCCLVESLGRKSCCLVESRCLVKSRKLQSLLFSRIKLTCSRSSFYLKQMAISH